MIKHVYAACQEVSQSTAVLTPINDNLRDFCRENEMVCYEGNRDDLVDRFYRFARAFRASGVIRVTGDCPLISRAGILYVLSYASIHQVDYFSNCVYECTDGQEVEYISLKGLKWLKQNATSKEDQEHLTTCIKKNMKKFEDDGLVWAAYKDTLPISEKMSVDTKEDLDRVRGMYKEIQERKPIWN